MIVDGQRTQGHPAESESMTFFGGDPARFSRVCWGSSEDFPHVSLQVTKAPGS